MAVSFINAYELPYVLGGATNLTLNKPTNTADNDILIASLDFWASFTVTAPAGWNLYAEYNANGIYQKVYWKKASSEGASWNWSWSGTQACEGQVLAYRGADYKAATPFDCTATTNSSASGTSLTLSQITTVTPSAMIVGLGFSSSSGAHSCAGFDNERVDSSDDQFAYDETQATAGATGNYTVTVPSGASSGILLALRELVPQVYYSVSPFGTGDIKTGYTDAFTGTDTTALATHDANWTWAYGSAISNLTLNTNLLRMAGWNDGWAYYNASSSDTCQITFKATSDDNRVVAPAVRVSGSSRGYAIGLGTISGGNYTSASVMKDGGYLNGVGSGPWDIATDHTIKIRVSGTTTVTIETWVDGVACTTLYDSSSPIGAGHPGFWAYNNNASAINVGDDWTDTPISITSGVMTIGTAQTGNIGQGCQIVYGGHTCYISRVNSSTSFDVVDAIGVAAADHASVAVTSISHVWASLSAAEAAATGASYINNTSLVTADVVANLCCYYDHDDYTADTTATVIDGYTSDSTRYINIYTPRGLTYYESINRQRHLGIWSDTTAYRNMITTENASIRVQDPNVTIDGLQVRGTSNANMYQCGIYLYGVTVTGTIVKNCIVKNGNTQNDTTGIGIDSGCTNPNYIINCIIYGYSYTGGLGMNLGSDNGTRYTSLAINCTIYNCTLGISSEAFDFYNCVTIGCTDGFGNIWGTLYHCCSDVTADISGNDCFITTQTDAQLFVDATVGNFNLVAGSNLMNVGHDCSTWMTAVDIIGTTRPQGASWDIGAFEYNGWLFVSANSDGDADGSITFTPTAGNTLIGYIGLANTGGTITDNKSNTWLPIGTEQAYSTSYYGQLFYVKSCAGGSTTFTRNGSNGYDFAIFEYSGVGDLDQHNQNSDYATSWTSLSITPTTSDELMFAMCLCLSDPSSTPTGWTSRSTYAGNIWCDKTSISGSYTATASFGGPTSEYISFIASFSLPSRVRRIGSYTQFNDGTKPSSHAVDVPYDAEIMVLCVTGYRTVANFFTGGTVTIDGHSMTGVTGGDGITYFQGSIFWADVTGHRGNGKTLAWDWAGTDDPMVDGGIFAYAFYKGVNLTTPTGDSDGSQDSGSPYQTKTLTASSEDLIISWAYGFYPTTERDFTWTNASEIFAATGYDQGDGSVAEKFASGSVAITAEVSPTSQSDGGICALVLKQVGGGTISLVQEGFRFRNDDGSETTATWKAAEDTGITLPSGNTVRLRLVIDSTGASNAIPQLEYRLQPFGNSWGNWTKVT